jgi:molybdopterin converting factor small subunit
MTAPAIEVHLFAAARAAVGASVVPAPSGTLAEVLDALTTEYPGFAAVRARCSYLLDGAAVHGDPADVAVRAGSRLDVLPPFAGG